MAIDQTFPQDISCIAETEDIEIGDVVAVGQGASGVGLVKVVKANSSTHRFVLGVALDNGNYDSEYVEERKVAVKTFNNGTVSAKLNTSSVAGTFVPAGTPVWLDNAVDGIFTLVEEPETYTMPWGVTAEAIESAYNGTARHELFIGRPLRPE